MQLKDSNGHVKIILVPKFWRKFGFIFFFVPLNEVVILDTLDLGHKESWEGLPWPSFLWPCLHVLQAKSQDITKIEMFFRASPKTRELPKWLQKLGLPKILVEMMTIMPNETWKSLAAKVSQWLKL